MKTTLKILAAALVAMVFASCSTEPIYYDASGNAVTASSSFSSKGKYVAPADEIVAAPEVKAPKKSCRRCLSFFCPKPDCCDTVSKSVLSRATAQGGTGEPHIGLIPTMKTIAP